MIYLKMPDGKEYDVYTSAGTKWVSPVGMIYSYGFKNGSRIKFNTDWV